jgi:hypothetical protein
MLDGPAASEKATGQSSARLHDATGYSRTSRRTKKSSYSKEAEMAERRRLDAEARKRTREEREKERRAMSKARRPDRDGMYRLGRQSKVLLNRVKRMVGEG